MAKYLAKSKRDLPYLTPQGFDDEASLVLAEYGNARGHITDPPIPLDDIVEGHFKLVVEIQDLLAEYPEGDVQGAIWFNDMRIAIDQRLVPEDFPAMLGRYRFTLAHELAHWRLHRHMYLRRANEKTLLPDQVVRPDHVLRSRATDPKEYQANQLAACILMPREMVKRAWHEWRGDMEPLYLDDLRANKHAILLAECQARGSFNSFGDSQDDMLLLQVSRPLAEKFQVSPDAMRIRLQGMKLLLDKKEPGLF